MERYYFHPQQVIDGTTWLFIYDTKLGNSPNQAIARCRNADVAQKIVDAMNAFDARRRSAAA